MEDIETAHRVGRPVDGKSQAVIVKLRSRKRRHEVLASRRALKGSRIVISEDLTQLNQKLLNRARLDPGVKSVWSWNGVIWIVKQDGRKSKVELFQDI